MGSRALRPNFSSATHEKAFRMWCMNHSRKQIAEELGVPKLTVHKWAIREKWRKKRSDMLAAERLPTPVEAQVQIEAVAEIARLAKVKRLGIERQLRLASKSDGVYEDAMDVMKVVLGKIKELDFSGIGKCTNLKGEPCLSPAEESMMGLVKQLALLTSKVLRPSNQVFASLTGLEENARERKQTGDLKIKNLLFQVGVQPLGLDDTVLEGQVTELGAEPLQLDTPVANGSAAG